MRSVFMCSCILWLAAWSLGAVAAAPLRLYLLADFTNTGMASEGIVQGISTALAMNSNRAAGRDIELIKLDYGGNSGRFLEQLERFVQDPQALALFSGLHSSPIMANIDFIHQHQIITLVPWAAAAGVTRYPSPDNCIFRVACDDSISGEVVLRHAIDRRGYRHPALLLEQSVWGKSNHETLIAGLKERGIQPVAVIWFNWGITMASARIILRDLVAAKADSIILIANIAEGVAFCQAMASLPDGQQRPIFSHWGITGGNFPTIVTPELRRRLDLSFIQTGFSFFAPSPFGLRVLETASRLYPRTIHTAQDLAVPGGFINACDLTLILLAAINQAGLTDDIQADRRRLRQALENLRQPVTGLIKDYRGPFRPFTPACPNAHEALRLDDFTMGYYAPDNTIRLLPEKTSEPAR